jgi:tetratricopeptide (TPR) repeat protein
LSYEKLGFQNSRTNEVQQQSDAAVSLLEVGKLYFDRGDFPLASEKFESAADLFLRDHDGPNYLKCMNYLLRIHAETEQFDHINVIKDKLQDLVISENIEPNSQTYYTLALCSSYKNQWETALDYLHKAFSLAMSADNNTELCLVFTGFAHFYAQLGRFSEALQEVEKLYHFFEVHKIPEARMWGLMNHAEILVEQKEYPRALELLWETYELAHPTKNMHLHISLIHNIGRVYLKSGKPDLARVYLNLAFKSVDQTNYVRLSRRIKEDLGGLWDEESKGFDLVFDLENHTLIEHQLGRVEFKNQHILLDLLKLFIKNPGQVYSKEQIAEQLWKQPYNPALHDNKIYVTIQRLRKLIEPDFNHPKYIHRSRDGYYMSKDAKLLVSPESEGPI